MYPGFTKVSHNQRIEWTWPFASCDDGVEMTVLNLRHTKMPYNVYSDE